MLKKYFRIRKHTSRKERKIFMRYLMNHNFNHDIFDRFNRGFTAHQIIRLDEYSDQQIEVVGLEKLYYCEVNTMFTPDHFFRLKGYHSLHLAKMIVSAELGSLKELPKLDKGRVQMYVKILDKL